MSDVAKGSIWRKEGIVVFVKDILEGMGGLEEEQYALITSGLSSAVIPCDSLIGGWENITNQLEPMSWQHVTSMSAGSEEETMKILDLMCLQAMEICSHGAVPFEEMDVSRVGNIRQNVTEFGSACGYWEKAIAQLSSEPVPGGEDDERQLVVQIVLYGKLFTNMFEDLELNEENIGEKVTITPQFYDKLDDTDVLTAVSFDLRRL